MIPSHKATEALAIAWAARPLIPTTREATGFLMTRNLLAAVWLDALGEEAARTYLEVARIYLFILTPVVHA